jgi:AcrR family transcriptional regulator
MMVDASKKIYYSTNMNPSTSTEPVERAGLRERKAAATRRALARALGERLAARPLGEITADEVAEAAGVSRVTFFNYFPAKERALEHIFSTGLFAEQCEARDLGLTGLDDVLHLFDWMAALVSESPARARELLAWFVSRPVGWEPAALSLADRSLAAPSRAGDALVPPRDRFLAALAAARRDGTLTVAGSDYELAHMLGVLLFGGALVGMSRPGQDWRRLFRHHVLRALDLDDGTRAAPRAATRTKRGKRARKGRTR